MGLVTPGGRGVPSKSILGNSGYRAGVPSGGSGPFKSLTMDTVPAHSNKKKRALLFIALLVVAGLVGFGLGALLWEGGPIHPTPPLKGGPGGSVCMDEQHNITGLCGWSTGHNRGPPWS